MTASDFEVDLDSAESILEITGWCLRADERLNEEKRGRLCDPDRF
ncbi:hypothetical protein [Brevibacterium ravenspurgense]|nr:hypothetical protein [Brevibacterium ravenspurgense]